MSAILNTCDASPVQTTFLDDMACFADVAIADRRGPTYTYRATGDVARMLRIGTCVSVPLGRQSLPGYVVGTRSEPPAGVRLRDIPDVVAEAALPQSLVEMIIWAAGYYHCSVGAFLAGVIPAASRSDITAAQQHPVQVTASSPDGLSPRRRAVHAALVAAGGANSVAEACRIAKTTATTIEAMAASGHLAIGHANRAADPRMTANAESHPPTDEQSQAIEAIDAARNAAWRPHLLHGVTGSGKTLVYLELAERTIARGKRVLLLVPEISLTPQLAARVRTRFPRVEVIHSALSEGERADAWRRISRGEADLILGPRSALFAPIDQLGLIVVDEEGEAGSYKQETTPRYNARDLAIAYAHRLGIPVVLGSATPTLETYHAAQQGRYAYHQLTRRPRGAQLPAVTSIDMRQESQAAGRTVHISVPLIEGLRGLRARGEQAIIMLNRRGFHARVFCRSCGTGVTCGQCDVGMVYHRPGNQLICHLCGRTAPMPASCPSCGSGDMSHAGIGTQALSEALAAAVPDLTILRMDSDTVSTRGAHVDILKRFADGTADVLVGTQMVAKGLDFPRVTLVGVVGADLGLGLPDFRAAERTFQLISQVSGRAGRASSPGRCIIQSWSPDHVAISAAVARQDAAFYASELKIREEFGYPPYAALVRYEWSSPNEELLGSITERQGAALADVARTHGAVLLGPTRCDPAQIRGWWRHHAILKAGTRAIAQRIVTAAAGLCKSERQCSLVVDIDPQIMM